MNLSGLPLPHGVVLTSASRAEMQGVLALVLLVCTTTLEPSDAFLASHGPLPSSPRQRTHPARQGQGKSRAEQLRAFNEQSLRSLRRDRRKQNPQGVLALAAQIPVDGASHMLLAQVTSAAAAVSAGDAARYFFAGGMCCGISSGATVPIDVVKTRMQTDARLRTLSVLDSASFIVEKEGISSLFAGFGSTLVGFTVNGAVKYGLYEVLKPIVSNAVQSAGTQHGSVSPIVCFLLAGALAEVVASTLLCPLEATRIRLVTDPNYGTEVFDALPRLWNEERWAVFNGLPAILLKMVPGTMCQMASYELLTRSAYAAASELHLDGINGVHLAIATPCALLSGVVSTRTSQPGDTILSEMNRSGAEEGARRNLLHAIREVCVSEVCTVEECCETEGGECRLLEVCAPRVAPSELFRGVKARLVHLLALVGSQLLMYDYIKVLVGLSATGAP